MRNIPDEDLDTIIDGMTDIQGRLNKHKVARLRLCKLFEMLIEDKNPDIMALKRLKFEIQRLKA